jgi:hypothetical protein
VNAIPCGVCTVRAKMLGQSMDEGGGPTFPRVSIHRLGSRGLRFGTVSDRSGSSRSDLEIEARRAKMVRRGASSVTILARGRVGTLSRHAEPLIESHPLLLANPPVPTGLDRLFPALSVGADRGISARSGRHSQGVGAGRDQSSRNEAPQRDRLDPRCRIGANADQRVPTGCVGIQTLTRRHPRGKGVLAA